MLDKGTQEKYIYLLCNGYNLWIVICTAIMLDCKRRTDALPVITMVRSDDLTFWILNTKHSLKCPFICWKTAVHFNTQLLPNYPLLYQYACTKSEVIACIFIKNKHICFKQIKNGH